MKQKQFDKLLSAVEKIDHVQSTIGQLQHFLENANDATPELMQSIANSLQKDAEKARKRILSMI